MTSRRDFLRKGSLLLAGAALITPTLEEIERLTWKRKLFPSARVPMTDQEYLTELFSVRDVWIIGNPSNSSIARVYFR